MCIGAAVADSAVEDLAFAEEGTDLLEAPKNLPLLPKEPI